MVAGTSFISKKIKEQGFLRKIHQKTYNLDPRSGKNSSRIRIWDLGGKKASDPGSGSATLIPVSVFINSVTRVQYLATGLAKTRVFLKKAQPSGFIWVFWVLLGFLNFRPIKSIFLPVFVLFIYLLADEFKIRYMNQQ
jgi:hypothetical protein